MSLLLTVADRQLGWATQNSRCQPAAFLPLHQKDDLSSDAVRDDLVMLDDAFRLLDAE